MGCLQCQSEMWLAPYLRLVALTTCLWWGVCPGGDALLKECVPISEGVCPH